METIAITTEYIRPGTPALKLTRPGGYRRPGQVLIQEGRVQVNGESVHHAGEEAHPRGHRFPAGGELPSGRRPGVSAMGCDAPCFESFRNLRDGEIFPLPRCERGVWGQRPGEDQSAGGAVWLFTGGHSFRGAKDGGAPPPGPQNRGGTPLPLPWPWTFFSEGRDQKAILRLENGRRSSVINGVKKKTGSALVGKVCAVIFSPEHLLLVKRGPAPAPRGFLDGALCQLRPSYAGMLHVYQRALAQRNALLKDIVRFPELHDTLSVWECPACQAGGGGDGGAPPLCGAGGPKSPGGL